MDEFEEILGRAVAHRTAYNKMLAQLDRNSWKRSLVLGWRLMRGGEQYKNNGRRYQRAIDHLNKAYTGIMETKSKPPGKDELIRVHLWLGMCLNECHDFQGTESNSMALKHYELAENYASALPIGQARYRFLASIWNSIGVADHHLAISKREKEEHLPIPKNATTMYKKALALTKDNKDDPFMEILQKIITSNMGTQSTAVKVGGGGFQIGGNLW